MKHRRWLWSLLAALGLVALTIPTRGVWLPWVAMNLVVADEPRRADLIVVFAAEEERARHAARLYQARLAPLILVTGGLPLRSVEVFCHQRVTGAEFSAKVLTDAGVPKDSIRVVTKGTSTYEEGEVLKSFMRENGYRSVIAVSSPYHMRRVRSTLSHLLRGTEISSQYSPAGDADFKAGEWWRHERDLIRVTNEYLKLAYYHLALF
jgi:uncharacterized SAM-binding protein YcdF (DUF218 family)